MNCLTLLFSTLSQALCAKSNHWCSSHSEFEKAHNVTPFLPSLKIFGHQIFLGASLPPIAKWSFDFHLLQGLSWLPPHGHKSSWLCWTFGKSWCFWFYISCWGIQRWVMMSDMLFLLYLVLLILFFVYFFFFDKGVSWCLQKIGKN